MRRKTYLATSLLILTWSVMPILGLQSSSLKISSEGMVKYPQYNLSWLHTDQRWIKDGQGNPVALRGVGLAELVRDVGFCAEYGTWYRHHETTAMYDWLGNIGVNLVRQLLNFEFWDKNVTVISIDKESKSYRDLVDDIVEFCYERGIYVILVWAADRLDMTQDAKTPYMLDPIGSAWVNWLTQLADRYKHYPNVWIDPMNEPPSPQYTNQTKVENMAAWRKAVIQAIQGIRSVAPKMMILVQPSGATWNPIEDFQGNLLPFSNIVYGYHHYYHADLGTLAPNENYVWPPRGYAQLYYYGKLEEARSALENRLYNQAFSLEGAPVIIDEFGVDNTDPNYSSYLKDLYLVIDKYEISFAQWAWRAEWSVNPDPNRRIKYTMLYGDWSTVNIIGQMFVDYAGSKKLLVNQ